MSAYDKRYRRNFVLAVVVHIALVGAVVFFEQFITNGQGPLLASVDLYTPADLLGEMPKGDGLGRGAYKPPEPAGGGDADTPGANQFSAPADESPAPPSTVSLPKADPNDVLIPKKAPVKKPAPTTAAKTPSPVTTTKKSTVAASPSTTAKTSTAKSTSAKTGTGTGKGTGNAEDIKNRFAKALGVSADGTPYGDGRKAGGGTGQGRIGSPTGAADGVVGGVGQGSPNWRYFEHVHDAMYGAWSQSGSGFEKKYVATVLLRIARDGTIADASLRIPSGSRAMDESVMTAVRKVSRLDPPPLELLRGEFANVSVDFQVEG